MAHELTSIAEKLDLQKQQLYTFHQLNHADLFQGQELRDLARKAFHKCLKDEILGRYFQGEHESACPHMSNQFEQALVTQQKYYLSMKIRKMHSDLGISSETFQRFVRIFLETMRENGISEGSQDVLVAHLHWYESYIISPL
jgi:truncated hemoglobin YjbI